MPRPTPSRRPSAGVQVFILLAVLGSAMLVCGGGVGALVFFAFQPAPQDADNAPEQPPPPTPEPVPQPEPATTKPITFEKLWTTPGSPPVKEAFLFLSDDGKRLFAQDVGGVRVFDANTGTQTARIAGTGVPPVGGELLPIGTERVMVTTPTHPFPVVFHVTGTQAGELLPRQMLPPPVPRSTTKYALSPDGRHAFVGSRNPSGGPQGNSMFRLFDTASAQSIGSGFWEPGSAKFTADGTRLFVAEPTGRCRWLKVPGGALDGGWQYPDARVPAPLLSMSADGGVILYAGAPAGLDRGRYVLDGKTGQVLRRLSFDQASGPSHVSADGRRLIELRDGTVIVTDTRSGTELCREKVVADGGTVAVRADGRAVAVRDPADGELSVFTLKGDPPSATSPLPPPLSPVPDALPPNAFAGPFPPAGPFPQAGQFPMPPPPITTTPRPAPPPALKARWTAPADVGQLALKPEFAPTFTRDGAILLQHGGTTGLILAYDAADGTPLPGYAEHPGSESLGWVAPFADRVASSGKDGNVKVWMARTGAPATDLVFPQLPIPGKQTYASYKAVSPTGRYTAHGRQSPMGGTAGQFRVMDTTTGKDVIEGNWLASSGSGHISFTPDELRVFVANGTGKAVWYKLPSGEKDTEWGGKGPQPTNRVASVSADGGRVVFYGKLNTSLETNIVDGRTGAVVRPLNTTGWQPAVASLSPDGALVALPVQDLRDGIRWHVDVTEVETGKKVGRVSPPREGSDDVPIPRFAPDGKSIAVTFRTARQIAVYASRPE
ncbi:MAG: hypothetical protein U0804_25595 [Gemmataceae bacterium]